MALGSVPIRRSEAVHHVTTLRLSTAAFPPSAAAVAEIELIFKKLSYYSRLRRMISYLNHDIVAPIDLDRAAGMACMERTSFSRFFKRASGITFREFVQKWRIAIALEQISASDDSLTEIAYGIGFESMSAFERTFKKVTGFCPSEYRRRLLARTFALVQPTTADSGPNSAYK